MTYAAVAGLLAIALGAGTSDPPVASDLAAPAPVHVRIEGVRGDVRTNVRLRLSIAQRAGGDSLLEAQVRRLHARAESEIRVALRPFGHYRPSVDAALEHDGRAWRAVYRIDAGEPVRIAVLDVTIDGPGADDPALAGVFERHRVRPGQPFRHAAYDAARQALQNRAASRGYLDAMLVLARVEVDTSAYEARVAVRMETGPRYRFGEVRFPETPFHPSFLHRFVSFSPGDPFVLGELLRLQRALAALDLFDNVEVEPVQAEAVGLEVPIQVRLRQRPRTRYGVGVGYGTDTGPRGTLSVGQRWLNPSAHGLRAEIQASAPLQSAGARYTLPVGRRADDEASATFLVRRERFDELEALNVGGGIAAGYSRGAWREMPSLRVTRERFLVAGAEQTSTMVLPGIAWSRVSVDDPTYPRRGFRFEAGLLGTATAIGSDASLARATTRLRVQQGLHPSGRLLLRLDAGATAVHDPADVPLTLRFFAGGAESVRGYDFRSLAPRDSEGRLLGGRHLLTGGIELEQGIAAGFAVALFTDAGGAFNTPGEGWLRPGAGAGLRWRSPVGPVRVDLAWPLDGSPLQPRFHFLVGGAL